MGFVDPYKLLIELVAAALLVAALAFGLWYYGHNRYETGYSTGAASVVASDGKAAKVAKAATAKREAAWAAQLKGATDGYHQEIDRLRLQPVRLGAVRLCVYTARGSRPVSGGAAVAGRTPIAPGTGKLQPVPRGNRPVREGPGPDIGSLLAAFASSADETLAKARLAAEAWPK